MLKNKMSKKKKVLITVSIVVLLVLVILAICTYFVGMDNLKSVYYGIRYDDNQITNMQEESSERLKTELNKYEGIVAREPTDEEIKAVDSGEITDEQLVEIISHGITLDDFRNNGYSTAPSVEGSQEPSENSEAQEENPSNEQQSDASSLDAECDEAVSRIVAKMYVLRSSYTSSLSSLLGQAYAEYQAGGSKSEIASKYLGMGQALEAECDGNVDALMNELSGILTSYGRSTELVDSIYQSYRGEKQYTKAYYMSMYLNN